MAAPADRSNVRGRPLRSQPRSPGAVVLLCSLLLALLAVACSDDGDSAASPEASASPSPAAPTQRPTRTRTPLPDRTFTLGLGPSVPATVVDAARGWLGEKRPQLRLKVNSGARPSGDLVLAGPEPGGAGRQIVAAYWIALANVTSSVDDITMDFLRDAIAGEASWSQVPHGKDLPVTLYLGREHLQALAVVLSVAEDELTAAATVLPVRQVLDRVLRDASALTILPLESVDTRGRSLAVDGVDLIRGVGAADEYPLVSRFSAGIGRQTKQRGTATALLAYLAQRGAPPDPIHILAVGDIIPARCVLARILQAGDFNLPFRNVKDKISEADIAFGTLDMQLTDQVQHELCWENYVHTGPTEIAEGIAWAGFDIIFNGTNHSMDGRIAGALDAVTETREAFARAGIETAGQGHDLEEALKPVIIEVKGVKFGLLAADGVEDYTWAAEDSPGTAPADPDTFDDRVRELLEQVDVVIATCECGIINGDAEYRRLPTELQYAMARAALDAGATEYIGGQSHWVQGAEFLGPKFIGYHMGNFVYDQDWSYETMHGAILDSYYIGTRLVNVRYSVVVIENMSTPRLLPPEEAERTLQEVWKATPDVPGSETKP